MRPQTLQNKFKQLTGDAKLFTEFFIRQVPIESKVLAGSREAVDTGLLLVELQDNVGKQHRHGSLPMRLRQWQP
jgi:hypothetical protein